MMLIVDNIHTYYGDAHVLHGVSLKVKRGQIVTLLGRNGAGKSTTLKSIMGIVPVRFGSVRFLDRNIAEQPCEEVARLGVAYVPEERGIIPNLTVGENLRLGILGSGGLAEAAERYAEAFQYFPALKPMFTRRGGHLSGGEQQMLALARAVVARPALMLVDEPTEGLSPLLVKNLVDALRRINEQGTTILLVEQIAEVAFAISSYVYVMDQGQIQFEGLPGSLKENEELLQTLLGV
jgi:branched-chain amino acid transport system ATP-binding protein